MIAVSTAGQPDQSTPLAGVRVLVGEPHQGLREHLREWLIVAGAEVSATGSLIDLAAAVTTWAPTVVLTAEDYPSGPMVRDVIQHIRSRQSPPAVLVHATSASRPLADRLIQAGAYRVRIKAQDAAEVLVDDVAAAHRVSLARLRR